MSPTNPRIIVVDDRQGIYDIVRMALELLDRQPRLIHVHTGDDALEELRLSGADLLLTAHTLIGTTNGPMLALMAKRELAVLPVIVLANERDPELDEETISQSPFRYLRRPFSPETLLRALRIALDGPEAVPPENEPEDFTGIVPVIDVDQLRPLLFDFMRDAGAMAIVMADRNGKVVAFEGAAGYIDRDLLAAALGPGFGGLIKLLPIIGEHPRVLKYYDGDKSDLFGLAVGLHHFIMLIFDGKAPANAIGVVKRLGTTSVNRMLEIIGDVAFDTRPVPVAAPTPMPAKPAPEPTHTHRRGRGAKASTTETSAVSAERTARTASVERVGKTKPLTPPPDPIPNFNPELFDHLDEIDPNDAEDAFSEDKLTPDLFISGNNKISFDDARHQGILGDMNES